ncbi:MAG: hypothetical protein ACO1SV_27230 [Fimbriimonas sp.]
MERSLGHGVRVSQVEVEPFRFWTHRFPLVGVRLDPADSLAKREVALAKLTDPLVTKLSHTRRGMACLALKPFDPFV